MEPHTRDTVHDENRGTKAGNPLTYFERCETIRGAMEEFNVPAKEYDFIPFPDQHAGVYRTVYTKRSSILCRNV